MKTINEGSHNKLLQADAGLAAFLFQFWPCGPRP